MICENCGRETDESGHCSYCTASDGLRGEDSRVRVLTREERFSYDGVTIEEDAPERDVRFEKSGRWGGVYYGSFGGSWLGRAALWLSIAAFGAFMLFVALPIAAFAAIAALLAWIVFRFFS